MYSIKEIIRQGRQETLNTLLKENPITANSPVQWGPDQQNKAHPLQYVVDCTFEDLIDEPQALKMARILLDAGADINGFHEPGKDTPLITACSLYTDQLALLYIQYQPDLFHRGVHGGTALHWAAWTGSSVMTQRLIKAGAPLLAADNDFGGSPLFWAVNGACGGGGDRNQKDQIICIQLLLEAGVAADHKDRFGKKALQYVDRKKYPKVAEILSAP